MNNVRFIDWISYHLLDISWSDYFNYKGRIIMIEVELILYTIVLLIVGVPLFLCLGILQEIVIPELTKKKGKDKT